MVYDIEAQKRSLSIIGHADDGKSLFCLLLTFFILIPFYFFALPSSFFPNVSSPVTSHLSFFYSSGIQTDYSVNAVCFADESSTNILVSGSDDGYVKVWDRRSLSGGTPSGVLVGATEGITYTSPKGDGRYIVVNSKDQAARLYDLRKMKSWSEFEGENDAVGKYGRRDFDCEFYPSLSVAGKAQEKGE